MASQASHYLFRTSHYQSVVHTIFEAVLWRWSHAGSASFA